MSTNEQDQENGIELQPLEEPAVKRPFWDPEAIEGIHFRILGEKADDSVAAALAIGALANMLRHGQRHGNREVGGLLLGQFVDTRWGPMTRIDEMIIAHSAEASLTHVTFTHAAWERLFRALDERDDDRCVVGWYHTHPGFGPFLSGQDRFAHEHFFTHPEQVAVVLDPIQLQISVFGWRDQKLVCLSGLLLFQQKRDIAFISELDEEIAEGITYVSEKCVYQSRFIEKIERCIGSIRFSRLTWKQK